MAKGIGAGGRIAAGGLGAMTNTLTPARSTAPLVYTPSSSGSSGGGGGGGGSAAAATAVAARPSLTDYINGNFLYKNQGAENARRMTDFDADTTRQQGLVTADQATREQQLHQSLDDQGQQNAEEMAGRGLLRSGLTAQNQDKINTAGAAQENGIQGLLTNFLSGRQTSRLAQEQANRQALADVMGKLTDTYNSGVAI